MVLADPGRRPAAVDRDEFLNEISLVLTGSVYQPGVGPNQTADLFGAEYRGARATRVAKRIANEIGDARPREAVRAVPAAEVRRGARPAGTGFSHWELAFARICSMESGPSRFGSGWVRSGAGESAVDQGGVGGRRGAGRLQPGVRAAAAFSATEITALRGETFARHPGLRDDWLAEVEHAEGDAEFPERTTELSPPRGAPEPVQVLPCRRPWMIGNDHGVAGFLHPEGVYDAPKGGACRVALYSRLRAHFQFQNEKKLFTEGSS